MKEEKYKRYIHDLGLLFKEKGLLAKSEKDSFLETNEAAYKLGYLMAFHEIISDMKQQAEIFQIGLKEIGLADIDPESDLL